MCPHDRDDIENVLKRAVGRSGPVWVASSIRNIDTKLPRHDLPEVLQISKSPDERSQPSTHLDRRHSAPTARTSKRGDHRKRTPAYFFSAPGSVLPVPTLSLSGCIFSDVAGG
jgi:hypothetical protein